MANPPELSPEQRAAALAKAAAARTARAELKEKLKMKAITLEEVLAKADTDETIGRLKVLSLLESLPGVGKVKARRIMEEIGISESRRVQGLGAHQRQALLSQLGGAS
jgi:DNA uptake protein ComE-like DNA-binding protein